MLPPKKLSIFIPILKKACTYVYMGYVERWGDNTAKLKIFFLRNDKKTTVATRQNGCGSKYIVPYIY